MVNLGECLKGIPAYFLAYAYILISGHVIPAIINVIPSSMNWLQEIGWLVLILTWFIAMIGSPLFFVYKGTTEAGGKVGNLSSKMIGIVYFIFAIILTAVGWFWIPALANAINFTNYPSATTFALVLFWIGTTTAWLGIAIYTPFTMISKDE